MAITKMTETTFSVNKEGAVNIKIDNCIMEDGVCLSKLPHREALDPESTDYVTQLAALKTQLSAEQQAVLVALTV